MVTDPPTHTQTHPPTHRQDRLQHTAPQLARSVISKEISKRVPSPSVAQQGGGPGKHPTSLFTTANINNSLLVSSSLLRKGNVKPRATWWMR